MTTQELFWSYRKGWRDGATSKIKDDVHMNHQTRPDLTNAYVRGYDDGATQLTNALNSEAERIGYDRKRAVIDRQEEHGTIAYVDE